MNQQTLVTTQSLHEHLNDPDWLIFDCRFSLVNTAQGEHYFRQNHIPGARYAHLDRDLSSPITPYSGRHPLPRVDVLADRLRQLGLKNDMQVVVYDDSHGSIAVRMWWLLRWLGHFSVALLDGGYPKWQQESRPLERAEKVLSVGNFSAQPESQSHFSTRQIERAITSGEICLLDARSAERFRGELEPIDPVAGHIPGAVNHSFDQNLTTSGEFKPSDELLSSYRRVIGDVSADKVVHMCGSGVTACHNLLAMEVAGLQGSALYPGSWSEWIRDESRPVLNMVNT